MTAAATRGRGLRGAVKRVVFPATGATRIIRFGDGARLCARVPSDHAWYAAREIILGRIYEPPGTPLQALNGVVIDAGAHSGVFTLLAAQYARRVVAIEPNEDNFGLLEENLARNRVADGVDAINAALWSGDEPVLFRPGFDSGSGQVASSNETQAPPDQARTVRGISLDSVVERHGPIDLLKLDIEGAEARVLASSARLPEVRRVVGELHFPTGSPEAESVVSTLRDSGFLVRVVPERALAGRSMLKRVVCHRKQLRGEALIKALLLGYFLAPWRRPQPGDEGELPGLYAVHRSIAA